MGDTFLENIDSVKDLGFEISRDLKPSKLCLSISKKAFSKSGLIYRSFRLRHRDFLVNMFTTFVRPMLEYGTVIWSPYLLKDIDMIENVQRKFTKRISHMFEYSYPDRLRILGMESLEYRRLIFDLEMTYKLMHNHIPLKFDDFFSFAPVTSTRSNCRRLTLPSRMTVTCENFFSNRVPRVWNSLPDDVVLSPNIRTFRNRLKTLNLERFLRGRESGDH